VFRCRSVGVSLFCFGREIDDNGTSVAFFIMIHFTAVSGVTDRGMVGPLTQCILHGGKKRKYFALSGAVRLIKKSSMSFPSHLIGRIVHWLASPKCLMLTLSEHHDVNKFGHLL